ncbi:MAG: hypothetical protein PVH01_10645, partial [Desulfobacterales bacterium]
IPAKINFYTLQAKAAALKHLPCPANISDPAMWARAPTYSHREQKSENRGQKGRFIFYFPNLSSVV